MKTWAWNRKPSGTGPFKVEEFVAGDHIALSRNENYWQPGKPYLDRVIVRIVPSKEVAKQLMKTGEADIMWNNSEADIPEIKAMSNVRLSSALLPGGEFLMFNLTQNEDRSGNRTPHPVLADINVRKAIALGIDKKTMIELLLNGVALPGTSDLNIDPYDCNIPPVPYDPAQARQLLDAAGWVPGSDGIRAKDGVRLRLKYQTTTGDKLRQDSQVLIVENMKAIGVELYIENLPAPVLFGSWASGSPINRGNFDIVMYSQFPAIDPHATMVYSYTSGAIPSAENPAGANASRWSEPLTDALIEQAGSIGDWSQRKELYCQAGQRIADGYSRIYLYQRFRLASFNDRVQGWIPSSWMGLAWNAADLWVTR